MTEQRTADVDRPTVADDRFIVEDVLGSGGYGVVYAGRQRSTGQRVALKVLNALPDGGEHTFVATERFKREMQVIGSLSHPNIVRLIDSGELESGELFIALEFVEGKPLHEVVRSEGGLSLAESCRLMTQVLEALSVAHQRGIVHRDLKPHNIMVTTSGSRRSALVLDFGIAGVVEEAREADHVELTSDRAITGSPAYMAPEQISHQDASPRMDIYSWGLLFIECISGKRAVPGDDVLQVMLTQVRDDPVEIPGKVRHSELKHILERATAKDVAERYQTVDEALADLEAFNPHSPPDLEPADDDDAVVFGDGDASEESDAAATVVTAPPPQLASTEVPVAELPDDSGPETTSPPAAAERTGDPIPEQTGETDGRSGGAPVTSWLIGVAVVAVLGLLAWWLVTSSSSDETADGAAAAESDESDPVVDAPGSSTVDKRAIVVLPFANLSADDENEYFSDGLSEELINALSAIDGLEVVPRTSAFAYKGSNRDVREIAAELGVGSVLEGSVRKAGDRIRVVASLVDGENGKQLWSETYDRSLDDVFAIQEEIARSIVDALEVRLGAKKQEGSGERLVTQHVDNVEAYNLYLRGRFFWNKRNPKAAKKAIQFLERAIDKAPEYALAWSALADMYNIMAWFSWLPASVGYPRAEQAALQALEIDPKLGEVYPSLAMARLYWHWDWAGTEEAYLKGIELAPDFATAHQWYAGMFLVPLGRFDEAREVYETARRVDPISPIIQTDQGDVEYYSGNYEKAVAMFEKTIEMHPGFFMAHYNLGRTLVEMGEKERALEALDRAWEASNESILVRATQGYSYGKLGMEEKARELLEELKARSEKEAVQAEYFARIYAGLGDADKVFEWLDKAVEDHSAYLIHIDVDPVYDPYRDDPRYAEIRERIGITAYEKAQESGGE